jgi:hypothetical protein
MRPSHHAGRAYDTAEYMLKKRSSIPHLLNARRGLRVRPRAIFIRVAVVRNNIVVGILSRIISLTSWIP